jgi:hypothetical protein
MGGGTVALFRAGCFFLTFTIVPAKRSSSQKARLKAKSIRSRSENHAGQCLEAVTPEVELGESVLDRIEVGAVGWQVDEAGAASIAARHSGGAANNIENRDQEQARGQALMNRGRPTIIAITVTIAIFGLSRAALAEQKPSMSATIPSKSYNPYPPGIMPPDLDAETQRVRHEIQQIFSQSLNEAKALGPVTRKGNPPVIAGNGYEAAKLLGELLNFDESMSVKGNQACAYCHMPYTGYAGPIPSVNLTMVGYPGSSHYRASGRTPMRYTYASRFPVLQFNEAQSDFYGGNFWDGRATGYRLQNPNAE